MKIDRFNQVGKFLDFDPIAGRWTEMSATDSGQQVSGIGDLIDDSCVALIVDVGALVLCVGRAKFSTEDGETELRYRHNDNGTTTFHAKNATESVAITYESWWVSSELGVPALGDSTDDEEDFCAYAVLMCSAAERRAHLVRRFSRTEA